MILAINASRAKSGGGFSHLIGIMECVNPIIYSFKKVHVWAHEDLAKKLPKKSWLILHITKVSEKSIVRQLFWERFYLDKEIIKHKCDILLNLDAGTVCKFLPAITLSRDMLSFEPREFLRYGLSKDLIRLLVLRYVQISSLKNSTGTIFLTKYASQKIQKVTGNISNSRIIPHGVGEIFKINSKITTKLNSSNIKILYISNVLPYKHQWNVIDAVNDLKNDGLNVELNLVGGGKGQAQKKVEYKLTKQNQKNIYIKQYPFSKPNKLVEFLKKSDIFVFASSCENMPNTLIEAMAYGIPIASSNKGPMPEVLGNGGIYFNPEDSKSIYFAIKKLIENKKMSSELASISNKISKQYSWSRCANETFQFLLETVNYIKEKKCQ